MNTYQRNCCETDSAFDSHMIKSNGAIDRELLVLNPGQQLSLVDRKSSWSTADASPLISPNQIYWVLSEEAYMGTNQRRINIEGYELIVNELDYCCYYAGNNLIAAFRGTTVTLSDIPSSLNDIKNDLQLSNPSRSCTFDKVQPATNAIKQLLEKNPSFKPSTTGHSLGGAVARCVGENLGCQVVSFNGAAPPTAPVTATSQQMHYHIVFDIISAWIESIRIDEGFRPKKTKKFLGKKITTFEDTIAPAFAAHSLANFKNKPAQLVSSDFEDSIWKEYYDSLPIVAQKLFLLSVGAPKTGLPLVSLIAPN